MRVGTAVLENEKILITGVTGKIAFPIARALAGHNEVWGLARLKDRAGEDRLHAIGVKPVALDCADGDFSALPEDFSYVFHAAVDPGAGDWPSCLRTNAHNSGELLFHCRRAKGFVFCSTGSIYGYRGQQPLRESDPPGVPLRANYSFSKVAAESVCTWIAGHFDIPLTIIRICSTYGPEGGAAADRLDAILEGRPIRLHPDRPNNYNPIYEDDYVDLGIRAMEAASTPPLVVNWAGSQTVSAEDYCTYMGALVGVEPVIEYSPDAHTPLWPDVSRMHETLGSTTVDWKEGFRRMVEAWHPELEFEGGAVTVTNGDETPGRLGATVLEFERTIKETVARAGEPGFGPESWAPLAELVAVDEFVRVGNFLEVMNWQEYTAFLTKWAAASTGFATQRRRMSELPDLVFLELQETNSSAARTTVVNSVSVYEFNDDGKIRHLDIYLQHEQSPRAD